MGWSIQWWDLGRVHPKEGGHWDEHWDDPKVEYTKDSPSCQTPPLERNGRTDAWTDGWTDGRTGGRTDGNFSDGRTENFRTDGK